MKKAILGLVGVITIFTLMFGAQSLQKHIKLLMLFNMLTEIMVVKILI